jgi:GNAT superfamily N-acetyltransferase
VVKDVESYVEQVLPQFSSLKPPKGITLILEHKEKPAGMGALKKLEDGVGEIKRMYVRPKFRGKGYGRKMFEALEDNAREFGLTVLRLDTGGLNVPARRLYESAGYVLRDK